MNDIEECIQTLIKIDRSTDLNKKDKIQELSIHLEKAINEKDARILNQLKMLNLDEDIKSILRLIYWIRDKNNLSFSNVWIAKCLSKKFKMEDMGRPSGESPTVRLTDNYIKENANELIDRIKQLTKPPAPDIKIKVKKESIDLQGWTKKTSLELVELAKKIDEDEEFEEDLDKEIAEKIRMVRDGRFATTWARYEAIIAATNMTKSLTHAIAEEQRPLTRVEITHNEHSCRECYCEGEPKNKCSCHCHRTIQKMTTKGLKWAIKHNKRLGEYDETMRRLGDTDRDDICPFIKRMFTNPNMDKHLSRDNKMDILTNHIEKEICIRCETFLDAHPKFFSSGA